MLGFSFSDIRHAMKRKLSFFWLRINLYSIIRKKLNSLQEHVELKQQTLLLNLKWKAIFKSLIFKPKEKIGSMRNIALIKETHI